jgi:hypothetical protein
MIYLAPEKKDYASASFADDDLTSVAIGGDL